MQRRALFCTITQEPGQGGIARVSSLLWAVMRKRSPDSWQLLTAITPGAGKLTLFDKMRFSCKVIWRQLSGGCDILFFDHLGLARVQRLVPQRFRRPYGIFLHSIEAWTPLSKNRVLTLANARVRIANSHYTANRVASAHPQAGDIDVCHLALGLEPHTRSEGEANADQELLAAIRPNSVFIVGRMMSTERHKGHEQLIRSWPSVIREVPTAQLVIVGGGDDLARLQEIAGKCIADGNILFTGWIDEPTLSALYAKAALFAMPSSAEGFGLVYLEAMARGLACIGSIHDAAREIIVDGETGFLVDQNAGSELAIKIVDLLKNRELRERFGHGGLMRLRNQFSLERFEARIGEALEKLAS